MVLFILKLHAAHFSPRSQKSDLFLNHTLSNINLFRRFGVTGLRFSTFSRRKTSNPTKNQTVLWFWIFRLLWPHLLNHWSLLQCWITQPDSWVKQICTAKFRDRCGPISSFPPAEPQSLKENIVRKGAIQPRELLPALTPIANPEVITTASNYMSRNLCERQQTPPSTVTDSSMSTPPVPLTPSTKSPWFTHTQTSEVTN